MKKGSPLVLLNIFVSLAGFAQSDLQNTGILYVTGASDILYVSGSFTNTSGATLTNNGNLYVLQGLSNAQVAMAAGTGTLFLNGSAVQAISGSQVFKTFNLVTNNVSGITLNNDLSISGVHTFSGGIIFSSATPNYLMYEAGSSYTGDGDNRHVKGWIQKTGNTAFVFPLGNGTVERTIGASNLSATSVFNANYAGATTNTGNLAGPLVSVDPNEYWILNRVSGGTATIDMNWNNSKIAMPPYPIASIRVANYVAGNWTSEGGSAAGNTTTTGSISSATLSSFGAFALGSISAVLPVHLVDFNAARSNNQTVLNWTIEDEINASYYAVQRSNDGLQFYEVAKLPARNLIGTQRYTCSDNSGLQGTAYYRLKSVDLSGKSSLSKIVMVTAGNNGSMSIVNPVYNNIHINYAGADALYGFRITSLAGQTLQEGEIRLSMTGGLIPLAPPVHPGVYILQVEKGDFRFVQKIQVH
jgi:hypothetical protein